MNQEEILNCIIDPERLKEISFERLKKALIDYPYSQNLHFLLTQKSMQEHHPDFERHLKTTATYMSSRSFLRKQLQQIDRPSQPFFPTEPETEPAQGNSITTPLEPEIVYSDLLDEDLPTVEFIPDDPSSEVDPPKHVADIITETPPADQPPPNETPDQVENIENIEHLPPIVIRINPMADQVEDPEIAPIEKKLEIRHEPIVEQQRIREEERKLKAVPEKAIHIGSNVSDLTNSESNKFLDTEFEKEDPIIDTEEPITPIEEVEIIEFPEAFDFDDEMDDLLSKPLIEVIPESFANSEMDSEPELEDEASILDLEEFDELLLPKNFVGSSENDGKGKPEGKWIKKYKDSGEKEKPKNRKKKKKLEKESKKKVKNKSQKTKKKDKKKGSKAKNEGKKKKKKSEQKLSKKKAIRKFANRSIVEDGETISITLADLYVKQGKIEKAIIAYERLSLIIPEKKAFFAALIKKLKKK